MLLRGMLIRKHILYIREIYLAQAAAGADQNGVGNAKNFQKAFTVPWIWLE
jgi:hypothetical protein